MACYTMRLCEVAKYLADKTVDIDRCNINELIEVARPLLFNFNYPIFDENYRQALETKLIRHYWFYEIGVDTIPMFRFELENFMNEEMVYFNQLYQSEKLEFNPLEDINYTVSGTTQTDETGNRVDVNKRTGTVNSNATNENVNRYSETPQGSLDNVRNDKYLTSVTIDNSTGANDSETTNNDNLERTEANNETEVFDKLTKGKMSTISPSQYLKEYRDIFLNVDMLVINKARELFMLVW